MTVKEYIQKGHKWTDMKGVPVGDDQHIQFIHNKFFEGEELKFQNKLIRECKKLCPKVVGEVRVYGGDTPDANMVDWIYTQCAEIVRSIEAVRDYLERDGVTIDSRCTQFIRGWAPSKAYVSKVARIFSLKFQYNDRDDFGEFTLSGFDFEQANKDRALLLARKDKIERRRGA